VTAAPDDGGALAERVEDLRARVADVGFWWHSIDLGDGVVTPGAKSSAWLSAELARLNIGDLSGKSVLDVGAYDGYYSFAAERLGAERVVALDHWVWSVDLPAWMDYREKRIAAGMPVEPVETMPDLWRPEELPGRRAFDLAHEALESSVEVVVGDLLDYDLTSLGTFDVVLYLGVLYHVRHPLLALERLAAVTEGTAIIETQAEAFRGPGRRPLCRFIEGDELNHDPSNFWTFNEAALLSMCRSAGFKSAEPQPEPGRFKRRAETIVRGSALYRAVVHAQR
jgi:tRNA (mo5U34)-methyltransferase